jgi:hypothetical protein
MKRKKGEVAIQKGKLEEFKRRGTRELIKTIFYNCGDNLNNSFCIIFNSVRKVTK